MRKLLLGLIGLLFAVPAVAADLPAGYTELQYIESTGTQWIDTGIKGNMSYKYEIDFQQIDSVQYRNWGAFNQQLFSGGPNMSFTYSTGFSVRWTVSGDKEQQINTISAIDANRHKIIIDNGNITWDGVDKGRSTGHQDNYQLNYNLFLGTINPGGTTPTTNAKSKYYSYKVWNTDGNLIQNFVPAKNSSGVVGMYDTVSGQFFTNAGTGEFIAGPVIPEQQIKIATTAYNSARFSPVVTELNDTIATIRDVVTNTINQTKAIADLQATKQTRPNEQCPAGKKCLLVEDNDGTPHWYEIIENAYGLPSGYTALEYIEGTGTQWIDTGVNIGENIQTKVKFGKTTNSFTKFGYVIGGGSHYQGLVTRTIENSYYMSMYSSSQNTVGITMPDDVFEVTFNTPEHKVIINNTDSLDLVLMSPYEINTTIGVFNTPGTSNNIGIGKVYSFVIKDNSSNSIVRNLVPAKNSSGVIGMYDTVSGRFFTNAGSGTFVDGPEI